MAQSRGVWPFVWSLAVLYGVTAWLGLQLAVAPGFATAVFPASGIALAFALYFGPRVLPGVLLGAVAHNLVRYMVSTGSLQPSSMALSVGIGAAATVQAAVAYFLVRTRFSLPNDLADHRDSAWLLLLGAVVACLIAPTVTVPMLAATGAMPVSAAPVSWLMWYLGDALGVVIFTPLTLLLFQAREREDHIRLFKVLIPVMVLYCVSLLAYVAVSEMEYLQIRSGGIEHDAASFASWNMLVVSLALCGLLEVFLLSITGRHAQVQKAVGRATEQLQLSNEQLETALQIQSRFLAAMSHEVRTPLNAIVGYADLLLHADLPTQSRDRVGKIVQASQDLRRLVNDILNASKTDAGAYELLPRPFALESLVASVEDVARGACAGKGLEFRSAGLAPESTWLLGDELRIRQILLNLLGNAVKYTEHGHVSLQVLARADGPSAEIQFLVQDSGPGISRSDLTRLFAPFSQLNATESRTDAPRQGVGLGLSISKNLALRMGGDIEVATEPGYGSTFRFRVVLPKAVAPPEPEPQPLPQTQPASVARILVVEDDLMIQELVATILQEAGHGVRVVGDGGSALAAVESESFDLILMDMRMPHMSGIETTSRIRAMVGLRQAPIVALTANAFSEDRAACLEAGMNDFLSKPFTADELLAVVGRFAR